MTWFFLLTLVFAEMGGGGSGVIRAEFSSEALCKSVRRAIWSQLPDMNGWLSKCVAVGGPDPVEGVTG